MRLTMKERSSVVRVVAPRYQKGGKKHKGNILKEFMELTGYNRCYAAYLLRSHGKRIRISKDTVVEGDITKKAERVPHRIYDEVVFHVLRKIWFIMDCICGKRLAPVLKEIIAKLEMHKEIELVGHEGGDPRGDFIQTLDLTDVCTTWTETQAVRNKAQVWVFEAIKKIRGHLPFDLLGIDSDNGSEFINDHLFRYCKEERITFTRSRKYRKNDNCYVEQKNYSVVRRAVGYLRYDTDGELAMLNELYWHLRLYTNYFQPVMKLIEKTRTGSRVTKRYDKPQTPYQRLIQSPHVPDKNKDEMKRQYAKLNPAELKRQITRLQNRLIDNAAKKKDLNRGIARYGSSQEKRL